MRKRKILNFSCKNKALLETKKSSVFLLIIVLMILVNLIFGQILGIPLKATPSIGSFENPFTEKTAFIEIKTQIENASEGDSFYFEVGIYNFKSDLYITKGMSLMGKNQAGEMTENEVVFISSENFRHISTKLNKKDSVLKLENLVLLGQQHPINDNFVGGGIDFSATGENSKLKLDDCRFENNRSSGNGGALNIQSGTAEISNSFFKSNSASNGGGIYNSSANALIVDASSFYKNKSGLRGGGINASDIEIKNSTFVKNTSFRDGGGIYIQSGSKTRVEFCTITENEVTRNNSSSGGVYSPENISIFGNIIVGNTATLHPDAKIGNRTDLQDKGFTGAPDYNIMGYNLESELDNASIFKDESLYEDNKSIYKMVKYEGKAYRKVPKTTAGVPLVDQRGYPRNEYEMEDFVDVGSIEYRKARNFEFAQDNIVKYEDEASFDIKPLINGAWDEEISSFTIDNSNVAAISSNGLVTVKARGVATVTAKTTSGATANLTIEIIGRSVLLEEIKLSSNKLDLKVGDDSALLSASALPVEAELPPLIWSTSDSEVAVINSRGEVTPLKRGSCIIKVESEDKRYSAWCEVTVSQPVKGIALSASEIRLKVGGVPKTLVCTVLPDNANLKEVTWLSSNLEVATVNANGMVTPIGKGSCDIWATSKDGGFSDKCEVIVTQPVVGIKLDRQEIEVKPGDRFSLTAEYLPLDADGTEALEIVWASGNEAAGNVDNSGNVTISSENINRTFYVTAKTGDEMFSASCEVIVKAIPVEITGIPTNGKVEVDSSFILSGNFSFNSPAGWRFDSDFFDVSFNGEAQFTAKKAGYSVVNYTNGDSFCEFEIEIVSKPTEPTTTTTTATETTTTVSTTTITTTTTTTTSATATESEIQSTVTNPSSSITEVTKSIDDEITATQPVSVSNSNSGQTDITSVVAGEEAHHAPQTGSATSVNFYLLIFLALLSAASVVVIRKKKI